MPVLLEESINGLNIRPDGIYVDLTFGGGGHSLRILDKLGKKGKLLAFDQDRDAGQNIIDDSRFTFIHSSFRFLRNFLRYSGIEKIDGSIADLGISSHQVDTPERGFSFMKDAVLDMRMNKGCRQTASDILNNYVEDDLKRIFRLYGDLKNAGAIASRIVKMRKEHEIRRVPELVNGLSALLPARNHNKVLAQIFQALRIEVNDEIGSLKDLLLQLPGLLNPGSRVVFLTYHSVEDRLVKNFLKTGNPEGNVNKDFFGNVNAPFRLVNKNIIVPSEEEINHNPRSRSARLRIAEKI